MIAYASTLKFVTGGITCPVKSISNLTDLINFGTCTIMGSIVPLLVSLAMAGFVYGVIKFFMNPDNEEKKKNGKTFMLWGIISLFVIVSIWGIVGLFSNSFLNKDNSTPVMPYLPEPKK